MPKVKRIVHKFNSRPHFWIKPVYSNNLIQGIHFPDGMIIRNFGTTVKHCRIGYK